MPEAQGVARALALAACLAAGASPAAELPLWEAGVGATVLRLPHYRGSDQSRAWLLPIPYFVYRGDILRADREGARAMLLDTDRVDLDLSLAATAPADSRDNRARAGMPDLAPTVEFGPNLTLRLASGRDWKLRFELPVRAALTVESRPDAIGWAAAPKLVLDLRVGGWDVGVLGGPLWGSRALNGYYYDVAAPYATPERPAYRADAGRAGWQATLGTSRRVGNWWVGAFVRADSLAGAAFAASPLVRERHNWWAGFAVSRVFGVSSERVVVPD